MCLLSSCYPIVTSVIHGLQVNPFTSKEGEDRTKGQINGFKIGWPSFPKDIFRKKLTC